MKKIYALILLVLAAAPGFCQTVTFDTFADKFAAGYKALNIPDLELSYVEGLKKIKPENELQKQVDFFKSMNSGLKDYTPASLNPSQKQDYQLMVYETSLNLERLALEQEWRKSKQDKYPETGVLTIHHGKEWYKYLLKKWLSADVTPDQIYQFGLTEVDRVEKHIEEIQKASGLNEAAFYKHLNAPEFFISDPKVVQDSFERIKTIIYNHLGNVFNQHKIPVLKIERGANEALAQAPGYYNNDTFYYNLFNKPFNNRQIDWLFIHEAVPGHHYQSSINAAAKKSKIQSLFFYIGLAEGWAAYTEELGKDIGAYRSPYDELGKWEWDIVRSVRVPMDIGLNFYGWTDEQALAFWKKHFKNQDDIAMREIARVKRWPAQCITYKYGAVQIMQWKKQLQTHQGKNFNIKDFHDRILDHGSLPFFMVKENVFAEN